MPLFGHLLAGSRPDDLGHDDGTLRPPPSSPNCAHSQVAEDHPARVEPLPGTFEQVVGAFERHPEVSVISRQHDYVHAEATTRIMGFVDDIELVPGDGVVHVRSASRMGQSDMGKNAARINEIRALL